MEHNLSISEFFSRITNAKALVQQAKQDYERCVLSAVSIAQREGSIAQEAESLGWAVSDAVAFSVAGTVFLRLSEAAEKTGGTLAIVEGENEVMPSEFVDKAKESLGKGGFEKLIYMPVSLYCLICEQTGVEPTLTGAMSYINKAWPKPEKRDAEDKLADDLESVLNRVLGQTADGKTRKAVPVTDRVRNLIVALNEYINQDNLVS